jgi:uncharacterized membrane protein
VSPLVIGLIAISAVLHVAWNVRLKTAFDPLRAATIGMIAGSAVIVPCALVVWAIGGSPALVPEGVLLAIASGGVEAAYFVLLSAAYRRGDLSVVYPIARGTAPILAVAIGVGLFGERLGVPGFAGVALLIAGFLLLQQPWRVLRGHHGLDPSIAFALATGVMIATYSAIDRIGTRLVEPVMYAAILTVSTAIVLSLWVAFVAGGGLLAGGPVVARRAAVGGLMTLGAYLLILFALSVAPLSGVAPLRESATVFAAAWGSVRLGEAVSRRDSIRRIGASVAIVGGALLLAVGS